MGHHHLPALPPVLPPSANKVQTPRWRPRVPSRDGVSRDEALSDTATDFAADAVGEDAKRQKRQKPNGQQRPGQTAATFQTLSDGALRTVLQAQESQDGFY